MIVLSDCYLFPGCLLPLFIFEMRYREMLKLALESGRMFCVGVRLSGDDDSDDIFPVTTAGLIRACVTQPDGTSHLVLYGTQRVRFTGWIQKKPFRIAKVEPLETEPVKCQETLNGLKERALALLPDPKHNSCDGMRELKSTLAAMTDLEAVCDIMTYHFVRRSAPLRQLMSLSCLTARYEFLLKELNRKKPGDDEWI